MTYAKIDEGTEIYYEVAGEGAEPLLLIMGTGGDHTAWAFQTPFFAQSGYRVVTPDNRGVGQTKTNTKRDEYTAALMADDMVRVLDDLGIGRVHASGMSLGSAIGQELALRHPDRVATLQLHVTWARTDAWLRFAFENFRFMVEHADDRLNVQLSTLMAASPALIANDEALQQWITMRTANPNPPTTEGLVGQWSADIKHETLDRLGDITCPTLVTGGEIDGLVPCRYAKQVAEAITGSQFHLFTGPAASHVNCIEMPEEFNKVSLDFLKANPIS